MRGSIRQARRQLAGRCVSRSASGTPRRAGTATSHVRCRAANVTPSGRSPPSSAEVEQGGHRNQRPAYGQRAARPLDGAHRGAGPGRLHAGPLPLLPSMPTSSPHLGTVVITRSARPNLTGSTASSVKRGLKPLSIRKSHAILSAAFNQAVKWGWVDRNPVLRSSPPTTRGREIHPPTPDELRRLLDACADVPRRTSAASSTWPPRPAPAEASCAVCGGATSTSTSPPSPSPGPSPTPARLVAVKDTKTHQARRIALDPSTVDVLRAAP